MNENRGAYQQYTGHFDIEEGNADTSRATEAVPSTKLGYQSVLNAALTWSYM